jgi:hypothetical protein
LAVADADTVAAVKRSYAQEADFRDVLLKVARRIDAGVGREDAPRLICSVDAVVLDAALRHRGLWAEVWPHLEREPLLAHLEPRPRARLCRVVAAGRTSNKSIRRLVNDPAIRRGLELITAHRTVCRAFGRYAATVDASRVVDERDLRANTTAYRVLMLLYNARRDKRVCSELPDLPADEGLPVFRSASRQDCELSWEIAARIDPVAVLALMDWWTASWASIPRDFRKSCETLEIDRRKYWGHWIRGAQSQRQWFGLTLTQSGWSRAHFAPDPDADPADWIGSMIVDGIGYVHDCNHCACTPMKWFRRSNKTRGSIAVTGPWTLHVSRNDLADGLLFCFDRTWAAGLHDQPLLTCPRVWEL